jgi:hypothetical protein
VQKSKEARIKPYAINLVGLDLNASKAEGGYGKKMQLHPKKLLGS